MTDINTHEFPPGGGWIFRQPQTGWTNPMAMVGFKASVDAIVKHRQANKAAVLKYQLSTDHDDVERELMRYTRTRLGIADPNPPSFFRRGRSSPKSAGDAVAGDSIIKKLSRLHTGIVTIMDLKRSGRDPVLLEVAEKRADTCVKCPLNNKGDFISLFTSPVARLIKSQIEEKRRMTMKTSKDSQLGVCDACDCPMELKIHFPLDIIKAHIKQPELAKLDPNCWILREE